MAKRFTNEICVRMEDGTGGDPAFPTIVGTPDDPTTIDAEDGDRVAVYRLVGVRCFRIHPRLEPK